MSGLLSALPIQLACQLITPGNHSLDNFTLNQELPNQPLPRPAPVIPEGYTAFPDIGVAMKYYANNLKWNLARKHCIAEGGNLAVIDSIEKSQYANALRKSNPRGALLGIHKLYDNAEWVSAKTGLPLAFIPWKAGMDHGASAASCTVLWGDDGGRVGPADCNSATSHTCEIPIW